MNNNNYKFIINAYFNALELPDKVLNLTETENNSIHWNPPLQKFDGEEKITHYVVSNAAHSGQSWKVTQNSFNYAQHLNLSNHGEYKISVQAVNCHGEGDPAFIEVNSPSYLIIILTCTIVLFFICIIGLTITVIAIVKFALKKCAKYNP